MPSIEQLLPRLDMLLSDAFAVSVNPPVNHARQAEVGGLIHVLDSVVPAGKARDGLHAGLWLLADDLGRAHTLCQDISTPQGAAWHAVVHRREGEFWNSKYWWRRAAGLAWAGMPAAIDAIVGRHGSPAESLRTCIDRAHYRPDRLVDVVEAHAGGTGPALGAALGAALAELQRAEWRCLFHECLGGSRDS